MKCDREMKNETLYSQNRIKMMAKRTNNKTHTPKREQKKKKSPAKPYWANKN